MPISSVEPLSDECGARRRRGAAVLANLAWLAVLRLRSHGEQTGIVIGEAAAVLGLFAAGWVLFTVVKSRRAFRTTVGLAWGRLLGASALSIPLINRLAGRAVGGTGAAWEMVLLTTFGIAALALAFCSVRPLLSSLSVVCSGFVLLFTIAISDQRDTFFLSIPWVLMCMWWMLANQWERLEVHLAQTVRRHQGSRLALATFGLVVCACALAVSWGQGPATRMLGGGVMPTSGGTRWSDPAARSGVGDGDAVVAAKKHAASFGAVESDLFLQSHQPSLFDLFDDVIGKPRPTRRSDKAVSLPNQTPRGQQRKAVQSQQGNSSFTTARQSVPKRTVLAEKKTAAVLHWVGPTGIRLAMQRYTHFDGVDWTQSLSEKGSDPLEASHYVSGLAGEGQPPFRTGSQPKSAPAGPSAAAERSLRRETWGERVWYFRTPLNGKSNPSELLGPARGDAVKIINLRSPRIPAPANSVAVHIADVGRDDFFGLSADDSFFMPGRSHVPSLTVVRLVTHEVDGDRLLALKTLPRGPAVLPEALPATAGIETAARLARQWTEDAVTDWERVERIIARLREQFVFDRGAQNTADDPLADFLHCQRGGDHLFATAAAMMLRSLGFKARLATGFYVPASGRDRLGGHAEILSEDAHVWVELLIDEDLWLALEPTPGYAPPQLYRTVWQRVADAIAAFAPGGLLMLLGGALLWRSRWVWAEWCCTAVWWLSRPLSARRRLALLVRLLDLRSRRAGAARPVGVTPQRWIEQSLSRSDVSLRLAVRRCFFAADAAFFGPGDQPHFSQPWLDDANQMVSALTVKALLQARRPTVSAP